MWISYLQIKNEIFYETKWSRSKSMLLEYYTTSIFTVSWQSWVNLDSCYFMWKLKLILIYIVTWIVQNLIISLYYSYYFIKKINIEI